MKGCCKGSNKKEQEKCKCEPRCEPPEEPQYENQSAECMPKLPPDELCWEHQRQEFGMRYACGAYLTRKFFKKSPDDALYDALYAVEDLMDFFSECADDPQYYSKKYYQEPCPDEVIRQRMNKECRKMVACQPICVPNPHDYS